MTEPTLVRGIYGNTIMEVLIKSVTVKAISRLKEKAKFSDSTGSMGCVSCTKVWQGGETVYYALCTNGTKTICEPCAEELRVNGVQEVEA